MGSLKSKFYFLTLALLLAGCGSPFDMASLSEHNEPNSLVVTKVHKSIFQSLAFSKLKHEQKIDKTEGDNTLDGNLQAETMMSLQFGNSTKEGLLTLVGDVNASSIYKVINKDYGHSIDGNTTTTGKFRVGISLLEPGFIAGKTKTSGLNSSSTYTSPLNILYASFAKKKFKDGLPTLHKGFDKGVDLAIQENTNKIIPEVITALNQIYQQFFYQPYLAMSDSFHLSSHSSQNEFVLELHDQSGSGDRPPQSSSVADLRTYFHEDMLSQIFNRVLKEGEQKQEKNISLAEIIFSGLFDRELFRSSGDFAQLGHLTVKATKDVLQIIVPVTIADPSNFKSYQTELVFHYQIAKSDKMASFVKSHVELADTDTLPPSVVARLHQFQMDFFREKFSLASTPIQFAIGGAFIEPKDINAQISSHWLALAINFKKTDTEK